jgi:polysaccharide deacetylase family sporulation protein PdaB
VGPDYSLGAIPVRILLLNRVYVVLVVGLLSLLGLSWLASVDGGTILTWAASERLLPIYSVDTTEKKVALSFDAAWGAQYTPLLLETLEKHDIKTTFFLVGFWIEEYPDVLRAIAAKGHEIGNHTANHPHLNDCSAEQIRQELLTVHEQIKEITGQEARLFRPPFGEYSNKVIEVAAALGYHTIQWSVDSLDWRDLSAEEIRRRVVSRIHPGAIVLFHNNGLHTAAALEPIINDLTAMGYQIVPISELLWPGEYRVDHQGRQIPVGPQHKFLPSR